MQFTGEREINAPREKVFAALNSPEVLGKSIPGCQEFKKISDTEMAALIASKIGPVSAKFQCEVNLSDIVPPKSYTLSGHGKGGGSMAKGEAKVTLDDAGENTLLRYEFNADISGKLAQLGSRLIEGSVMKLSDDFFSVFAANVTGEPAAEVATSNVLDNINRAAWIAMALVAAGIAAYLLL